MRGAPFIGLFIVVFSLVLAFVFRYNHFYEFLLVGLFLIFYHSLPQAKISSNTYFKLYGAGIIAGFILDFVFGLKIGNVWYYNYSELWEYTLLYLLVYPLGGIVMLQTYLFFENWFHIKTPRVRNVPINRWGIVSILLLAVAVILLLFGQRILYFGYLICTVIALSIIFYMNYLSERINKISYFRCLLLLPIDYLLITLLTTYFQAFIHEIPNVFARQWVYQNMPFESLMIFDIPTGVLVGWILLTVGPVSLYYCVNKK